ncbi:hypothetical protein MIDIC_140052 [Alphaproteobacteria bacterium]
MSITFKRGKRLIATRVAYKKQRLSIIAALSGNKIEAPVIFEGYWID